MEIPADIILSVGDSTLLYQVQGGVQNLISQGAFVLSKPAGDDTAGVVAKIGEVTWTLTVAMPCLRSDDHTYTFAVSTTPEGPVTFYCVIFQKDLGQEDIELLQSALFSSTAYSGNTDSAASTDPAPKPTWDDGQDAAGRPESPPAADTEASTGQGKLKDNLLKGGMMLGAGLRRAAQAAGAGYSAAKAKAEASITPETKAKLEAARSKLDAVGRAAGKAASVAYADAKAAAGRLVDRASNSELARSESLRSASKASREKLSEVYEDMKRVGEKVLAAIKEAATRARGKEQAGSEAEANVVAVPVSAISLEPAAEGEAEANAPQPKETAAV